MARTKSLVNRAELIVEAAISLFSHYGYERTSIEDIAKHLGIGKGSVYLEFKTKEDILMKIIEQHAIAVQAMLQERIDNIKGSPLKALQELFLDCSLMVYDHVTRDIHTPEALLHTSLQVKSRFSEFYVRKRKMVHAVLLKAAEAGEIPKSKATEEMAIVFLMTVVPLFPPYANNYTESKERITRDELQLRAKQVLDLVVNGLKN